MNEQNNLEFKLLMKNIKKNNIIIEKRIKTRQEFRKRREERDKKFEEVFKRNELNEKKRKNDIYKRQMSRDLKNIQKRYEILKPEYDENDLYYNNKDIKNKRIGNKINAYSNNRRQHLNDIKNNFYKKNQKLKIEQNNNFIDNLNNIDKEMKFFEKPKSKNDINETKNTRNYINNNNDNNNIKNFNKNKINKKSNNLNNKRIDNNNKNDNFENEKYQFKVIDNKLNEKNVNNICFDGNFFEKFPDITKINNPIKNNSKNKININQNKKI